MALEKGIILAPGSMFSEHPEDHQCMRFNIPHTASQEIQNTLSVILAEIQTAGQSNTA